MSTFGSLMAAGRRLTFEEQLEALVANEPPSSVHTRPDGTVFTRWEGYAVGWSMGAGQKTHSAYITKDTGMPKRMYQAATGHMGRFGTHITMVPVKELPTCERCLKAVLKRAGK